jgi:hypothetical protein
MIHTSFKKPKKHKPNAKQRDLDKAWEALLKKYPVKNVSDDKKDLSSVYSLGKSARRETPRIPSLPFTGGPCPKAPDKVYTGTMIKGIGTMHKSNAVPIFSNEEAIDIATMRR